MFSSALASCTLDSGRGDITLLSFPVADFRLGVSCLESLRFLSIGRVFTGASPPAHSPSTPPRCLRCLPAPPHSLGPGRMESVPEPGGFGGQAHPRRGAGRRLSGGGSRSARAQQLSREAGAARLRLLCVPARLGGESAGAALPSCSASRQEHGGAVRMPSECSAQVRRIPPGTAAQRGTALLR